MLTIVDYGMGNLNSVAKAFENLRAEITVSSLASDLERADRIVLPGVGAFAKGMKNLNDLSLVEPLRQHVCEAGKPFLGLCLGMQLLAEDSYELGHHQGLGWLPATVKPVEASGDFKSIHIGWNDVSPRGNCPLFAGLGAEPNFYFVHGYHVVIPVGHVEAGLRTGDKYNPFPEEINRVFADLVADLLFAPTTRAERNLLLLGIDPGRVFVTGNTAIDALLDVAGRLDHLTAPGAQKMVCWTVCLRLCWSVWRKTTPPDAWFW